VGEDRPTSDPPAESEPSGRKEQPPAREAQPTGEEVQPSATTLASVADKVHGILEAAEATAAAIRREAEADATRAVEERERKRRVEKELSHLSGLADALSVHAEAVRRQCDVVAGALDLGDVAEPSRSSEQVSTPAGPEQPGPAGGPSRAEQPGRAQSPGTASAPPRDERPGDAEHHDRSASTTSPQERTSAPRSDPATPDSAPPSRASDLRAPDSAPSARLPSQWLEAYRMRLGGASRDEVEAHLRRSGAEDAGRILTEVFRNEPEQR
jgi:hypothetical protein